jgi:hypothetical protein
MAEPKNRRLVTEKRGFRVKPIKHPRYRYVVYRIADGRRVEQAYFQSERAANSHAYRHPVARRINCLALTPPCLTALKTQVSELEHETAELKTELAALKTQLAELRENFGHLVGENAALRQESAQLQRLSGMSLILPAIRRHRENWTNAQPEAIQ